MCRLFAFSFTDTTDEERRVSLLNSFRDLAISGTVLNASSPGHSDGWGTAIYTGEGLVPAIYKSTLGATHDVVFEPKKVLQSGVPQTGLVHLRKKTVGETSLLNTHPFVEENYSFIHNGTVDENTHNDVAHTCIGNTDSERLFRKFLSIKAAGHLSTKQAFEKMLKDTMLRHPNFSAINTILHDGDRVYVSRVINMNNKAYSAEALENYYTLYIGTTVNGDTFVTSEKIGDPTISYTSLPNESYCVIERKSGEFMISSLR